MSDWGLLEFYSHEYDHGPLKTRLLTYLLNRSSFIAKHIHSFKAQEFLHAHIVNQVAFVAI